MSPGLSVQPSPEAPTSMFGIRLIDLHQIFQVGPGLTKCVSGEYFIRCSNEDMSQNDKEQNLLHTKLREVFSRDTSAKHTQKIKQCLDTDLGEESGIGNPNWCWGRSV